MKYLNSGVNGKRKFSFCRNDKICKEYLRTSYSTSFVTLRTEFSTFLNVVNFLDAHHLHFVETFASLSLGFEMSHLNISLVRQGLYTLYHILPTHDTPITMYGAPMALDLEMCIYSLFYRRIFHDLFAPCQKYVRNDIT